MADGSVTGSKGGGIELPPRAPSLMQSLRALGYTVEASIADLVDNSITARAESVGIEFSTSPEPYVAIIDDGTGMSEETLVEAMRFGSADPRATRAEDDLGRFGLGLKTASLAQCRQVTVLSIFDGRLHAVEWDLDECERRGSWWLRCPSPDDASPEFAQQLRDTGRGTVVLWRKLDRLVPDHATRMDAELDNALAGLADHLGFTFHRFTDAQASNPLRLTVNGRDVPGFDPFLEGHPRGQKLHEESFTIEGEKVVVTPFVLPFPSRLTPGELDRAGGRERVKSGHGFYVYRGRRLVVPGGWFRIVPADELVRLARLRVDVPTRLDHLWKVDVRKTVVEPPAELRRHLKRIVGDASKRSRRVYQFRGNARRHEQHRPLWSRNIGRDNAVSWCVDRDHPAVRALSSGKAADVERLLRLVEDHLPLHDIHVHLANDVAIAEGGKLDEQEMLNLARALLGAASGGSEARQRILENLEHIEPFSRDPEMAVRIAGELAE